MKPARETLGPSMDVDPVLAELVDEITNRIQAGGFADLSRYAREHPEQMEQLQKLLPAIEVLAELKGSTAAQAAPVQPVGRDTHLQEGVLGDYRIVREIGRGGMGVVYEAEQVSLGRKVALKVLPFAAVLDQRQLHRFKNEAQAAAQLHHQNIVPVYSVGCERGVHYYAMQYIEGQTLGAVIGELRHVSGLAAVEPDELPHVASEQTRSLAAGRWAPGKGSSGAGGLPTPTPVGHGSSAAAQALASEYSTKSPAFFRSVCHLGIQAAQALDHAHESGVLHRDIKPGNLLLDIDGHLWITDFGLAHMESEPGMTMTGDILGTVRYMSPEQALARRIPIDHRTDIYSLGVTLYELLTLRPAFTGRDRQELLRQIAFEEPRQPRRVNSAIPAELETIVLKAVSKNPAERYDTAQDLADDLERFLEDKPIQARRPTLVKRATKWSRRHRAVVASGVVLLVMAVIALSVSTALIWREQARTSAALDGAEAERTRAEANFQKAREAVEQMLTQATDKPPLFPPLPGMPEAPDSPDVQKIKRALLEDALPYYEWFLREHGDDPLVRYETAHAYKRVGDITGSLGQHERAEETYARAAKLLLALADEFPDELKYRAALGDLYRDQGLGLQKSRLPTSAEKALRQAIDAYEQVRNADGPNPRNWGALARVYCHLSYCLRMMKRWGEAETAARQCMEIAEECATRFPGDSDAISYLCPAYGQLAALLKQLGRLDEAEELYLKAIPSCESAFAAAPRSKSRIALAFAHAELAMTYKELDRLQDAVPAARRAIDLCEAHDGISATMVEILRQAGEIEEAKNVSLDAISALETQVADAPGNPILREHLLNAYLNYGLFLRHGRHFEEAEEPLKRSQMGWERFFAAFPDDLSRLRKIEHARNVLGDFYMDRRRLPEALALFLKAISDIEARIAGAPRNFALHAHLLNTRQKYANLLRIGGRYEEAEAAYDAAADQLREIVDEFPDESRRPYSATPPWDSLFQERLWLGDGYSRLAGHLIAEHSKAAGRLTSAREVLSKAVALNEQLMADASEDSQRSESASQFLLETALKARDLADALGDRESFELCISLWEQAVRVRPDDASGLNSLAWLLATCPYLDLRDASRSVELAERAVELLPPDGNAWLLGKAWGTVGAARYRAGYWPGAIEALNRAVELLEGGDNHEWVFLAMAHWRLGEKDEALRWYDQATSVWKWPWSLDGALIPLLDEAAELMGRVTLLESAPDLAEPQKGRPRVYIVLGDEHVESAEATGSVRVQVEQDGPEPRVIVSSERTGEVCPYDLTVRTATGSATIRGAIVNAEWKIQVFPYKTDPREDVDAWRREAAEHVAFQMNDLNLRYEMGGPSQLVTFDPRVVGARIPVNYFGTIATTEVTIPEGRWEIRTVSDDGVRVWVDGDLLIDNWTWHGTTVDTAELTFDKLRSVEIRVEYFELAGWAELSFDLRPLPSDDELSRGP